MNRSPYSAYRGRKGPLHKILIAIVILLVIALVVATLALFILPNYVVYTPEGPQLVLPMGGGPRPSQSAATKVPTPTPVVSDSDVVVEPPKATPTPTPAPVTDLSGFPRRDMSLGLVLVTVDTLPEESSNGVLVDVTDADLTALGEDFTRKLAGLPYAAAYLRAVDADVEHCAALAARGFDELVLAENVPSGDGAALAKSYEGIKKSLDDAGWQGRLGLVLDQELFDSKYDDALVSAIARSFDRLYFRTTLKAANKTALTGNGFEANGYTLVTAVRNAADLNYAWAILPD